MHAERLREVRAGSLFTTSQPRGHETPLRRSTASLTVQLTPTDGRKAKDTKAKYAVLCIHFRELERQSTRLQTDVAAETSHFVSRNQGSR